MPIITKIKTIEPKGALIFYPENIEYRSFQDGVLGAEEPIKEKFLEALFEKIYQKRLKRLKAKLKKSTMRNDMPLSSKLKYADTQKGIYIWTNTKKKHHLFFQDNLPLENKDYQLPNILFCYSRGSLEVFFYKKFSKKSYLYSCFLPNVNTNVCMGTAQIQISKYDKLSEFIQHAENQFFNSLFTHTWGEENKGMKFLEKHKGEVSFDLDLLEKSRRIDNYFNEIANV